MSKYTKTMRDALAEMSEAFSKKQIKMAIGIASDPRYKQGNYSGAVRQIEKLKKGLSDHPQVAAVLKRQNEEILEKVKCPDCEGAGCPKCEDKGYITDAVDKEDEPFLKDLIKNLRKGSATHGKQADDLEKAVNEADFKPHMMYDPKTGKGYKAEKEEDHLRMKDMGYTHEKPEVKEDLDEAKFSDSMIDKLKKAYEPMKGKKINPTPLMKIFDKIDSNKDGLEQLYKADIPFVSMMAMSRLMLKHNYKADDINKLGKIRREDFVLDEAINEAVNYNFAAVDKKGKVIGFASKESDAKDMARRNKGRVVTLTKPLAPKKGDMMVNRPFPDEMDKFPTNTSATQGKRMEEVELDERKFEAGKSASGYDIFHKDFSSAMQHATAFAKKKGQPIKKDEIDNKVATGPKKPSSGKENSYTLETEKGKMWSVQVYNMGSKFELNMYLTSSHVPEGEELDEMKMNDPKLNKIFDKLKKGSKVKLKTSSTISQGKDYVEYIVKSKNTVNKGRVEKITLATVGNEKAVKKFLYKRDGQVTFAIGDMGASIDDIKESTNEVPENMAAYLAAITKQLGER